MQIDENYLIYSERVFFEYDLSEHNRDIEYLLNHTRVLVIGGAGSIGSSTIKQLLKFNLEKLYVIDINENALAELVRDIRSSLTFICEDFKTFCIDIDSLEFDYFCDTYKFDYILNFSALKHVRSEKDPFTLMRMLDINIFNSMKMIEYAIRTNSKKYFCVSTDKAAKPTNLMGSSKRIMELFLLEKSSDISISTARFANVLFSNGSLTLSFLQRIQKHQPIAGPNDILRYFVTYDEAGILCLLTTILGQSKEIFIPKLEKLKPVSFIEIAEKLLKYYGYKPYFCESEKEAKDSVERLLKSKKWPCYFSSSDTTGEKEIEEFAFDDDLLEKTRFEDIDVIFNNRQVNPSDLYEFTAKIKDLKVKKSWSKDQIVEIMRNVLKEEMSYIDKGKYLDDKM